MNIIEKTHISGAIGLSVLKKDEKEFFIFYDQHNNELYCSNYNAKFLDSILEKHFINNKNSLILLEELIDYGKDDEIITIWKNTYHTKKFKEFFLNNKDNTNVVPFDIRTLLFPISPFLIINDSNEFEEVDSNNIKKFINNTNIDEYFYLFFYFFDLVKKNVLYHKKYKNIIKIIKSVKKKILSCFKTVDQTDDIYYHFKKLKNYVNDFKNKFIDKNSKITIAEFLKINSNKIKDTDTLNKNIITSSDNLLEDATWIEYVDTLSNCIIEFYAILLFFCFNKKQTFLHSGLVHSANIVWLLRNHYKYESIYDKGITDYENLENNVIIKNCIAF